MWPPLELRTITGLTSFAKASRGVYRDGYTPVAAAKRHTRRTVYRICDTPVAERHIR